jgi:hypothetical protein
MKRRSAILLQNPRHRCCFTVLQLRRGRKAIWNFVLNTILVRWIGTQHVFLRLSTLQFYWTFRVEFWPMCLVIVIDISLRLKEVSATCMYLRHISLSWTSFSWYRHGLFLDYDIQYLQICHSSQCLYVVRLMLENVTQCFPCLWQQRTQNCEKVPNVLSASQNTSINWA